ncbi:MAG: short-chain dehydrogenase [Planctomycetota bacterium]|nr:MAG: short-chain dehydrogenase [Planctomycetota bacterium]
MKATKILSGQTAIVTGGGSGIGQAISIALAQKGANVCVLDIKEPTDTLSEIDNENNQGHSYICDVSNEEEVKKVLEDIKASHGLDILINNAGISHVGNVLTTTSNDFNRLFDINVKGVFHFLKYFIELLDGKKASILNLASIASKIGIQDRFAYSMTKGAVLSMTLSVAKDFVGQGVRCNCICPARVHTPFVDDFVKTNYPEKIDEMMDSLSKYQPIGRMGTPAEIAKLATFLVSEEASFITGAAIDIDGGVIGLR